MKQDTMTKIEELVYQISHSAAKASARAPLNELQAILFREGASLTPYAREKFSELVSLAQTASGQVQEKGHWVNVVNSAHAKFRMAVGSDSGDE